MSNYSTPAPISAVLDIPAGRVRFIAADRADTAVEVRPADASKGSDREAAAQTTVTYGNGILQVTAPRENGSVEVTVGLPAGSRVDVTAAATEFRAAGRLGDVTFDGAYREIKVDEAASLRLSAADGDVQVGRLTGAAEISTQRGDIRIAEAVRGAVVLRTQAGDISVGVATGVSAALTAETSYGRVTNALKNDGSTALDLHATTTKGDIVARSL